MGGRKTSFSFVVSNMNETIWNTTSEVYIHFFLGGITIFVYSYAIFLCYAIYDYQDEKPNDEKCPLDHLIKDWVNSQFCYLYYVGLVQFISLFTPSINLSIVYIISHIGVFLLHWHVVLIFVYVYLQYIFTFQPQDTGNVLISTMRKKCFLWKLLLVFISLLMSIIFPLEEQPIPFQLLSKGLEYKRYGLINKYMNELQLSLVLKISKL